MTDIFEEVDQSLREDKLGNFWKRWQFAVYGVVAVVVVGVGVFEFMRWQRDQEIDRSAKVYDAAYAAMEKQDLAAARTEFLSLANDKTGFGALSGHMLAGLEKQLTNDSATIEKALADAAAKDTGILAELATLKLAYTKADSAPITELESILKPLLAKKGYSSALARELVAAKALSDGDVERARDEFETLELEIEAPDAMKQRVRQALLTLPPRPVAAAPAAAAPAATTPAPATTLAATPATTPAQPQPGQNQ